MSNVPTVIGQVAAGRARAEAESVLLRGERALYVDGDLATARGLFTRAHALAEEAGDRPLMAAGALGLGGLWVHEHRPSTEAAHVEARQRGALAGLDPPVGPGAAPAGPARGRGRLSSRAPHHDPAGA